MLMFRGWTKFTTKYFAISSSFPDMQTDASSLTQFKHLFPHPHRHAVSQSRLYHADSGLLRPALTYRREENKTKYFRLLLVSLQMQCSDNAP